jgi:hypothetical protein
MRRGTTRGTTRDNYQARLKAAGIDTENMPEDMDEFRWQFARVIAMFLNEWHGCPERLCRRHRGCMAPHNFRCSNWPPSTKEEMDREWELVRAEVYKELKAALAAAGVTDT